MERRKTREIWININPKIKQFTKSTSNRKLSIFFNGNHYHCQNPKISSEQQRLVKQSQAPCARSYSSTFRYSYRKSQPMFAARTEGVLWAMFLRMLSTKANLSASWNIKSISKQQDLQNSFIDLKFQFEDTEHVHWTREPKHCNHQSRRGCQSAPRCEELRKVVEVFLRYFLCTLQFLLFTLPSLLKYNTHRKIRDSGTTGNPADLQTSSSLLTNVTCKTQQHVWKIRESQKSHCIFQHVRE